MTARGRLTGNQHRCIAVDDTVCGERFGRCRCVDRDVDACGIGARACSGDHLHLRGTGPQRTHGKTELRACTRSEHDTASLRIGEAQSRGARCNGDFETLAARVLHEHGQLELVAVIEETRCGDARHERLARCHRGFTGAEVARARHRDCHDTVAREAAGQAHTHLHTAVRIRAQRWLEHGERSEICAHVDFLRRIRGFLRARHRWRRRRRRRCCSHYRIEGELLHLRAAPHEIPDAAAGTARRQDDVAEMHACSRHRDAHAPSAAIAGVDGEHIITGCNAAQHERAVE